MRKMSIVGILALLLLVIAMPAGAQDEIETYVLGVAQPFTGPLGSFGTDFSKGIELAVEEMNAELEAAGSNVRFEIASADTEGTPDGAARAVQTIVQTTGAQVIVGPLTTSEVLGAKQFVDENDIVIVAPASSGAAAGIPDDNIFRVIYPSDNFAARAFAEIAVSRGYQNVAILHVDDPFGIGLSESFTADFTELGGGEVVSIGYAPDPTDLTSEATSLSAEVSRLMSAGDTAVLCVCFLADAQKLFQVTMIDPVLTSVEWMGIENLANPELLADAGHAEFLQNANFISVSFVDTQTPLSQPFVDAFTEKFGAEPGPFTNYAYDAANIAMLSMLVVDNDGAAVSEILPFVSNHYIGTSVQAYLDANGDQAIARYGIYNVSEDATEFTLVGTYDGSSGELTLDE
ncbi:MAG: ABC transporter substrate-binding protein [Burkholderiales bacterium]|nr:ABC transporter substrate-binding protein [Anaerolineae bacterium]